MVKFRRVFFMGYFDYAAIGIFFLFIILFICLAIALYAVCSLPLYFIYKNIGLENPWRAFVPIWGIIPQFRCAAISPWFILLSFIPYIGSLAVTIVYAIVTYKFNRSLGKSELFSICAILFALVTNIILAYTGDYSIPEYYNNYYAKNSMPRVEEC